MSASAQEKRSRMAGALGACAIILALAAAIVVGVDRRAREAPTSFGAVALGLSESVDRTTRIVVTTRSGRLTVEKSATGGWRLRERGGHPVAEATVKRALASLAALRATRMMTRNPERMEALALGDPTEGGAGVRVQIEDARGARLSDVVLGFSPQGAVYARRGADMQSFAVNGAPLRFDTPGVWLDLSPLKLERADLRSVAVSPEPGPAYVLVRASADDRFRFAPPFDALEEVAPVGMSATANAVLTASPSDLAPASSLGLPPIGRVRLETFDGLAVAVEIFGGGEQRWMALSATALTPDAVARAEALNRAAAPWVYRITDLDARTMLSPLETLVRYRR